MSIELRPLGVRCNIGCQYCYQNMHRDAGNGGSTYDMEAMKAALVELGSSFHIFGGEPLLVPKPDLEELFRFGQETFGNNGIQTNGSLVDADHVAMFATYDVGVGLSMDGPGPLNDARWAGTLKRTRAATARSEASIDLLLEAGVTIGLMVQLTQANCSEQRLPRLLDWFRDLDRKGVPSARLHILEIEHPAVRERYAMSVEDNLRALKALLELEGSLETLEFDLGRDMRNLLKGQDDDVPCVWRGCDPYTTEAVYGIDGDGEPHNCGLTDKEGINFQKPDVQGYERYIALYHTPQEHGGCKDCRFFLMCKGQCPGTAMDRDWRNRTEYCEVWKRLFTQLESELVDDEEMPVSLHPRRPVWEAQMLRAWAAGDNPLLERVVQT